MGLLEGIDVGKSTPKGLDEVSLRVKIRPSENVYRGKPKPIGHLGGCNIT